MYIDIYIQYIYLSIYLSYGKYGMHSFCMYHLCTCLFVLRMLKVYILRKTNVFMVCTHSGPVQKHHSSPQGARDQPNGILLYMKMSSKVSGSEANYL